LPEKETSTSKGSAKCRKKKDKPEDVKPIQSRSQASNKMRAKKASLLKLSSELNAQCCNCGEGKPDGYVTLVFIDELGPINEVGSDKKGADTRTHGLELTVFSPSMSKMKYATKKVVDMVKQKEDQESGAEQENATRKHYIQHASRVDAPSCSEIGRSD
jgi:hypothetical protein